MSESDQSLLNRDSESDLEFVRRLAASSVASYCDRLPFGIAYPISGQLLVAFDG